MNEAALKALLITALREEMPGAFVMNIEQMATSGTPDTINAYQGITTWLEIKHVAPRFKSKGIQRLTCAKLAMQAICWYIIYDERKEKQVLITSPYNVLKGLWQQAEVTIPGFDHKRVAQFIRQGHNR